MTDLSGRREFQNGDERKRQLHGLPHVEELVQHIQVAAAFAEQCNCQRWAEGDSARDDDTPPRRNVQVKEAAHNKLTRVCPRECGCLRGVRAQDWARGQAEAGRETHSLALKMLLLAF